MMKIYTLILCALTVWCATRCGGLDSAAQKQKDSPEQVHDMMTLEPLKDQFKNYFMIGNIVRSRGDISGGAITNERLLRHYAILTPENDMKPDAYGSSRDDASGVISYNWTRPDNFVNAASEAGFLIQGHVLLWHSQIPAWQKEMANQSRQAALSAMKQFISDVMSRYRGKMYAWDVLNEIFPDGVSAGAHWREAMRKTGDSQAANPWYVAIGADFVYEGYKAARLADSNAILYYNDYNMDSIGKSTLVRNMVRDINEQWKTDSAYDGRFLIEGIGMQSHHNTNVQAVNIRASLERFKALGVRISISELDILSYPFNGASPSYSPNRDTPNEAGKAKAAGLYGEYFKLFLEYSDVIERVTFWGVFDEQSWRSAGKPLLFEGSDISVTKPAYYRVMQALADHQH